MLTDGAPTRSCSPARTTHCCSSASRGLRLGRSCSLIPHRRSRGVSPICSDRRRAPSRPPPRASPSPLAARPRRRSARRWRVSALPAEQSRRARSRSPYARGSRASTWGGSRFESTRNRSSIEQTNLGGAQTMANDSQTVRRTVQFKFTLPSANSGQLASLMKSAAPFYEAFGARRMRLLQNVDDPARFVHEIEYETHELIEINRQRVASDPRVQASMQTWRSLFPGSVEIDVYQEIE